MQSKNGLNRIEAIAASLNHARLNEIREFAHAQSAAEQPWLILGCSDGMGLNTTIAAIEAGVLKRGLGVFWEPPHLLEMDASGAPVSPVHHARVENAHALAEWAKSKHGVAFDVVTANVVLTPPRSLKGEPRGEMAELPAELVSAFEAIRGAGSVDDAIVVNSVAFGKWICPREGHEPITVPSIDFDGRLVETRTKAFHPRGYEETLDTMGRNHLALLEAIRTAGWLGPRSLTAFYTWAGGSQNVTSLEGIYGKGALGDAKLIAERDVAAFRIAHPVEKLGAHAIVRLPAFLSAALMGIPGAGLFGLISQRFLESKGHFDDMPTLASHMIRKLFGPEWIRENPISQIELDLAECLWIEEIDANVREVHQRIAAHIKETGDEFPLDVATSTRLLEGLAPANTIQLLGRFRPGQDDASLFEMPAADLLNGLPDHLVDGRSQRNAEIQFMGELSGIAQVTHTSNGDALNFEAHTPDGLVARGRVEFGEPQVMQPDPTTVGVAVERRNATDISDLVAWSTGLFGQQPSLKLTFGAPPKGDLLAYRSNEALTVIDERASLVLRVSA